MLYIAIITIMVQLISLIFIIINFYWVSIIDSISSTQIGTNAEEEPFGTPSVLNEPKKFFRFKTIGENYLVFLFEIDKLSCD